MAAVLLPPDLASRSGRSVDEYVEDLRCSAVLLVMLEESAAEMIAGLMESLSGPSARLRPSRDGVGFYTRSQVVEVDESTLKSRPVLTDRALAKELSERTHFIVPLRRRTGDGAGFQERISIGRARNNDVILRHETVSKFHAWLEADEEGVFYVCDARSTCATTLNGTRLLPQDELPLQFGDVIAFGGVRAFFCESAALWRVLPK